MQPSPDAVGEFKVVTNNMSAEYGRSAGATINVAYRSGTNRLRGSGWEFARRTGLNATGFFKPADGKKPQFDRDQFGAVLGGPILRNRAFFFADVESLRQDRGQTATSSIATLAQRQGLLAVDVRNPITGVTYPAGTPIPMTEFARKVLTGLPEPTAAGTANNYVTTQLFENATDKAGGKVDVVDEPGPVRLRPARLARRRRLRQPADPAAVWRRRQRHHLRREHAGGVRRHLHAVADVAARSALRLVVDDGGQEPGGPGLGVRARCLRHHRPA